MFLPAVLMQKNERLSEELLRAISPHPLNSPAASGHQSRTVVNPPTATDRVGTAPLVPSATTQLGKSHVGPQKDENLPVAVTPGKSSSVVKEGEASSSREIKKASSQSPGDVKSVSVGVPGSKQDKQGSAVVKTEPTGKAEAVLKAESVGVKNVPINAKSAQPTVSSGNVKTSASISAQIGPAAEKVTVGVKRHRGPLFDFPSVARKFDGGSNIHAAPWGEPRGFEYDVRVLLLEEGVRVVDRKRSDKLKRIEDLLAAGNDCKELRPDQVLKLRIEQRKLRLMELQSRIRDEVEEQQQEIMAMGERAYRKFVRLCERQRLDLTRQVMLLQKNVREKQLKSLFQWRKKLLEAQWGTRDARISRNRGVAKYHERMLREFSKRKDEDRTKRMEALKNNDVDAYREMLMQQQTQMPGDAGERFEVLSSFLTQTEEYLQKLGGKISAVKNQQEREEAALFAAAAARAQVGNPQISLEASRFIYFKAKMQQFSVYLVLCYQTSSDFTSCAKVFFVILRCLCDLIENDISFITLYPLYIPCSLGCIREVRLSSECPWCG